MIRLREKEIKRRRKRKLEKNRQKGLLKKVIRTTVAAA